MTKPIKRTRRSPGVKTCKICEKKPRAHKTTSYCKACNVDYMKNRYNNNPQHRECVHALSREWARRDRKKRPEVYRERERLWWKNNPKKVKEILARRKVKQNAEA